MTASKPSKPRAKRGELPKPILQQGSLGFLPFNALSASYLHHGHGDLILGYRDTEQTMRLKARTAIQMFEPDNKNRKYELNINGRFFNSFTDALYRGKLPQVIVAMPQPDEWQALLVDFTEYLQRLLSMGFFVPKKELLKRDPVEDHIPCFILAGEGVVFASFMTGLSHHLNQLEQQHPNFTEPMRRQIVGRFVRGFAGDDGLFALSENESFEEVSAPLLSVARLIRIAGGSERTLATIQSALSLHSLVAVVENRVQNAAERLELENAWQRLMRVVIPSILGNEDAQQLAARVHQSILAIGRKRQAFEENETDTFNAVPTAKKHPGMTSPMAEARLQASDALILHSLSVAAEKLEMPEEQQLFEALAGRVVKQYRS